MSEIFEQNTKQLTEQEKRRLETLLSFNKGSLLKLGVRGSKAFLESVLRSFRDRSFTILESSIANLGNDFPIPDEVSKDGYVVVVNSTGDWDNHTMNKKAKTLTPEQLKISDIQNAVLISWTENNQEISGGGTEFDSSFVEK